MIVAFMNALDEENRNGRTIPITMSNPVSARLHHGGSRCCTASRHSRSCARNSQALAAGTVLPIRRTDANYTSGGGTVTIPALGVPAAGLIQIHGWRESDGSAPLTALARRLEPTGPVRFPGPMLPEGARWLSLRASSPDLTVDVTADLRDPQGAIRQVTFEQASLGAALLRAPVPPGRWELEAL